MSRFSAVALASACLTLGGCVNSPETRKAVLDFSFSSSTHLDPDLEQVDLLRRQLQRLDVIRDVTLPLELRCAVARDFAMNTDERSLGRALRKITKLKEPELLKSMVGAYGPLLNENEDLNEIVIRQFVRGKSLPPEVREYALSLVHVSPDIRYLLEAVSREDSSVGLSAQQKLKQASTTPGA